MQTFSGATADGVWQDAYRALGAEMPGVALVPSRAGDTDELLHVGIEISDPLQRWIVSRSPAMNPALSIAEVISILAGSNAAHVLNYWYPGLPRFQGHESRYPGAYGYRLRNQFGIDQIRRAVDILGANPESRQVVLQLWDPRADIPKADGTPRSADVPCNVSSILKIRNSKLEWTQIMRSNDLFRGLPYNVVQFTALQEVVAGWLGVAVGSYHHWSDSLHVYTDARSSFSCNPNASLPPNTDSLMIKPGHEDRIIGELYRKMERLTQLELDIMEFDELMDLQGVTEGYRNLFRVLGAESARRRGWIQRSEALGGACTNPQLESVWQAWTRRVSSRTNVNR